VAADGPAQRLASGRRRCLGAASDGLDHQDHGCLVNLKGGDLDEETTVSPNAAAFAAPAYSNVGLVAGDTLSVRELLMATMISSGDAAYALAEHVGGGEAGVQAFVGEMIRKAERLGLNDTRFENPVGFDARGHHTSARPHADNAPRDALPRVPRDGRDGVDVPYRRGETIDLVAERGVESLVDASPRVELETELREELPDSAKAGVRLWEVVVRVDGKKIGGSSLEARTGYREASLGDRVWYTVEGICPEER
jgi:hypothetical protein